MKSYFLVFLFFITFIFQISTPLFSIEKHNFFEIFTQTKPAKKSFDKNILDIRAEDNQVKIKFRVIDKNKKVKTLKEKKFLPQFFRVYKSRNEKLGYIIAKKIDVNYKGYYEFTDNRVKNKQVYYYSIRAVNGDDEEKILFDKIRVVPEDSKRPKRLPRPVISSDEGVIHLRWKKSDTEDFYAYRIYRSDGLMGKFLPITEIENRNKNYYDDKNIVNDKHYTYYVTVIDESGNESTASQETMSFTKDEKPPKFPDNLVIINGDSKIKLRFRSSPDKDLDYYKVYQYIGKVTKYSKFKWIKKVEKNDSSFTEVSINNLKNGVRYNFYVTAVDSSGNESARTVIVDAIPHDLTPPEKVKNLKLISGNKKLKIIFDEVEDLNHDIYGYRIYRKNKVIPKFILHKFIKIKKGHCRKKLRGRFLGIFKPDQIKFTDNGLLNGVNYSYYITVIDKSANESKPSRIIDGVPEDKYPPESVKGLRLYSNINSILIKFKKNRDRDLKGYIIYRKESDVEGNPHPIASLLGKPGKGKVQFYDRSVIPGIKYEYSIQAIDESGNRSKIVEKKIKSAKYNNIIKFSKIYIKNRPYCYIFSLDPNEQEFSLSRTLEYKKYDKFSINFKLKSLPPNFSNLVSLSFQKINNGISIYSYNPESLDLYFNGSPDMENWGAWTLLDDDFPLPPLWNRECVISFEQYSDRLDGYSYNPHNGSVYYTFTRDMSEWHFWRLISEDVTPPPNYSPENHFSISSDDKSVTLYSLNLLDKTLYIAYSFDKLHFKKWYKFNIPKFPNLVKNEKR